MEPLTFDDLDDRSLGRRRGRGRQPPPGIDPWCSGPDWQLPVAAGFAPDAPRLLLATADGLGFALLSRYRSDHRTDLVSGLEPLWGFGSPLLGPDTGDVANQLSAVLAADRSWSTILLPGLPPIRQRGSADPREPDDQAAAGDRTTLPIAVAFSSLGRVGLGEGITRQVIDLDGGYEAWLSRRSPKFRRNLRRGQRTAAEAGLAMVDASTDDHLFDRLHAIEQRSWKGREGSGITGDEMATMYRSMIDRLRSPWAACWPTWPCSTAATSATSSAGSGAAATGASN